MGPENPVTSFLAQAARGEGDYARALALLDESLTVSRARGDGHAVAFALREVGALLHVQGDYERAIPVLRESLASLGPLKDIRCTHDCLVKLADALCEHSAPADVSRLFGAAEALRERSGRPLTGAQLSGHDRAVAICSRNLPRGRSPPPGRRVGP